MPETKGYESPTKQLEIAIILPATQGRPETSVMAYRIIVGYVAFAFAAEKILNTQFRHFRAKVEKNMEPLANTGINFEHPEEYFENLAPDIAHFFREALVALKRNSDEGKTANQLSTIEETIYQGFGLSSYKYQALQKSEQSQHLNKS